MKLKQFLLTLLIFFFYAMNGQKSMIIYEAFDAYINNTGNEIEGDFKYTGSQSGMFIKTIIIFKNRNKNSGAGYTNKVKIDYDNTWGFKLNDVLFRMCGSPHWVAIQGELIYYESGIVKLINMKSKKQNAFWAEGNGYGYPCGISKDLNSEYIYTPVRVSPSKRSKKKLEEFIDKNPEYKSFYKCVANKNKYVADIRRCAERFTKIKVSK